MPRFQQALLVVAVALLSRQGFAKKFKSADFDLVRDFATSGNPNGSWTYGHESFLGGQFTQFFDKALDIDVVGTRGWIAAGAWNSLPIVVQNPTASPVSFSAVVQPPDLLRMHPGFPHEISVIRWTCPVFGEVSISGAFQGLDKKPTSTDAALLLNAADRIYFSPISDYGIAHSFSLTKQLKKGDFIDFTVGPGADQDITSDSTGLKAVITVLKYEPGDGATSMTGRIPGAVRQVGESTEPTGFTGKQTPKPAAPPDRTREDDAPDRMLAFTFGGVFVAVMLVITLLVPHPSPSQWFVFRVTLALAAAGAGATIPGLLVVNVSTYVRAGGALALFVLIYLANPPTLIGINRKD